MMKRLILVVVSVALSAPAYFSQGATQQRSKEDELAQVQLIWLNDLKVVEAESSKLEGPLARALAKAEIAAAAWDLDKKWSKELLRKAYELTFPEEEEQIKLRERAAGSQPVPPTSSDRARNAVSRRVLQVASRDRVFARELVQLGRDKLGAYEAHLKYTTLASQAFTDGDKENASRFLVQAIGADPTQVTAALMIRDIAPRDRALADNLILQYIERLQAFPLSSANQSLGRAFFILSTFVFPQPTPEGPVTPPGPAVMRAYVSFVIHSLTNLQDDPAYMQAASPILISTWPLVRQYAPELTGVFLALEQRSRRSSDYGPQTPESVDELYKANKARNDQRMEKAFESDKPDIVVITQAVNHGDFARARKMIDKLPDGDQKTKLIEFLNMREALNLAARDDIVTARTLAERLNNASSILEVYPAIINKCQTDKNNICVNESVVQGIKQLRRADTKLPALPRDVPTSSVANEREIDPVLLSLSRFTKAITPINEGLAWDILDELVLSANRSQLDTSQGRTGFEADTFRLLGQKNETRAYQAANNLKDHLERIVALANIYQGLSDAYSRSPSSRSPRRSP